MFFKAFNVNVLRIFESSQHFLNGSVHTDTHEREVTKPREIINSLM